MQSEDVNELVRRACERGFSIIPVNRDKRPQFSWKAFQGRRATAEEVRKWASSHPPAWAVIGGAVSKIVILDFDGEDGRRTLELLGLSPHVITGSGGAHVYFRHPGWPVRTLNSKSKHLLGERYPGTDIRADGGYAVFAGINEKGPYRWVREMEPDPLDLLPMDARLFLGLLNSPEEGEWIKSALTKVQAKAGRNNTGFWLATTLRDKGYEESEALRVLTAYRLQTPEWNVKGQVEEYTEAEVAESVHQAYRRLPRMVQDEQTPQPASGSGKDDTILPFELWSLPHEMADIVVNDRELRDVSNDCLTALRSANDPPNLFSRFGQMVSVMRDEDGRPGIREVSEAYLRGRLTRSANFCRTWRGRDGEMRSAPTNPPIEVVRDVLALSPPHWGFPPLENVSESPLLRADGTVVDSPGYDPEIRVFYAPSRHLKIPSIPSEPISDELAEALSLIGEAFEGFPFVDQSSRANAYAMFLTPMVRRAVQGSVPVALIDAPEAGTGKSLLAELVAIVHTGAYAAMKPAPSHDEEEWRKTLSAVLLNGNALTIFDNVSYRLDSGSLSLAVTASTWTDRVLGQTLTITVPQRTTWIVTGNNIGLGGDMPRRCYWIRLDAATPQPWQRSGFKIPDLQRWARDHRPELLASLLILCRAWFAASQPPSSSPVLGSFEGWSKIVGGILAYAGIESFLGNLENLYEQSDPSKQQWESFLGAIYEEYAGGGFTIHQLVELIRGGGSLGQALPEELVDDGKGNSFQRRIATAFRQRLMRRYGSQGFHLVKSGEARNKVVLWRVRLQDDQ